MLNLTIRASQTGFTLKENNIFKALVRTTLQNNISYISHNFIGFTFLNNIDLIVDITLLNDVAMAKLNYKFRKKDQSTNVLSLQYITKADFIKYNKSFGAKIPIYNSLMPNTSPDVLIHLGDIFISLETVQAEATAEGIGLYNHFVRLVTHGMLHILGYNHITEKDAKRMYNLESKLLSNLKINTKSIISNYW